ncbi:hypothetical protein SCA6_000811 [Theobroma cacao]
MANATIAVHEEHELKGSVDPRTVLGHSRSWHRWLLDSMYPTEMEEILKRETKEQKGNVCPDKIASLIAGYALHNSFDRFAFSPFEKAAKKAGLNRMGGKVDDITVVVRIVQS